MARSEMMFTHRTKVFWVAAFGSVGKPNQFGKTRRTNNPRKKRTRRNGRKRRQPRGSTAMTLSLSLGSLSPADLELAAARTGSSAPAVMGCNRKNGSFSKTFAEVMATVAAHKV